MPDGFESMHVPKTSPETVQNRTLATLAKIINAIGKEYSDSLSVPFTVQQAASIENQILRHVAQKVPNAGVVRIGLGNMRVFSLEAQRAIIEEGFEKIMWYKRPLAHNHGKEGNYPREIIEEWKRRVFEVLSQ